MCMNLGDEPKQKQNIPSRSNGTNPKGGAVSSGLSKKDIDDAIKILDQEKQKLNTEIKREQQNLANKPNDTFEKELADKNIEDEQVEVDKDLQDPTIESNNSETQEKQELPNLTTQVSKDGSIEEKKNEKSTEKENKTDNKKATNEEDQETFDDKSNFVDPSEADPNGIIASPDYIDYTPTGNATEDAANRAEIAGFRQRDEWRKEDANQRIQDRIRHEEEKKQEKEDRAKDEIFDKQWDDYQNGKRDTAPTRNKIDDEYNKNQVDRELGRQSDDTKPNSSVNNNELQPVNNSNELQQPINENSLLESRDSSLPVANPETESLDLANQQNGNQSEYGVNQDGGQEAKSDKKEGRDGRIVREDRELKEEMDKARSKRNNYTEEDHKRADKEKKDSLIQDRQAKYQNTGAKMGEDGVLKPSTIQAIRNEAKLTGDQLGRIGNKLNTVKNIAQDPGGAAKKAAEDKLKEYAQKAAREAAKRAAQMAARVAQAAGSVASSIAASIGGALAGAAGILIPVIIAIVLFIAIFSAVLVDAYCTPRPVVRGIIEYALTGDQKNLIQAGDALPIVGGLVAKFGNVVGTKSELYKQVFYNKGGICPDKSPDKCATGSGGDSTSINLTGTINGCFNQEILKNPTVEFIKAQGLVKYTAQTSKIKEIYDVGKEAGVPDEVIKWVIALSPTESDMRWDLRGSAFDCYGIIQFCRASGASCTFQIALYNVDKFHGTDKVQDLPKSVACGASASPSMSKSGDEIKGDKVLQMKMAWAGFKLKKAFVKGPCKLWSDRSEIYRLSAAWLGCTTKDDNGSAPGGTKPTDYGQSAESNFNKISCAETQAKEDGKDNIDKLIDQLAININDTITNNLKATITNQVKDRLSRKDQDSLKPIDQQQNGNILTRLLGGLDVEAAGAPGSFTYSGEDTTVIGMITSGKIKDVITAIQPSRGTFKSQVEKKYMEPNSLKGLISVVNSGKFDFVQISSAYRAGDNPTSGHGSGQKFDIDALGYKGKTYTHQSGNDGDTASVEAFYELAKTLKDTGVLIHIISGGKIFEKISGDSYLAGTKIIRDDKSSPIYGAIHENHYDLRFNPKGTVGSSNSGSSNSSNGCPCGDSNGSSTATGDGTISKGGDFTPEIRAFLDVLAEEEVPKDIHLKRESYFAGNQIPAKFTEDEAKTGHPGNVGGKGSNVGRYQFNQGDYNDAKAADSRIKDYGPEGQDLVALYKLKYRKVLPKLQSGKIEDAFEAASAEWESVVGKNDTILTGGSPRRGQKSPTGRTMAKQVAYYNQRLAVYKASSFIETADKNNKLAQLQTGDNESRNILDRLLNGIEVKAQSASTVAEKRAKLKELFKKGFIAQTINVQKDDALGYESGYDDNMIGFMYDLYYKAGITWIGGPFSWGRSGGDHGKGDAMDAWAFGYVSEIEGKNQPIKGYTGPVALYPSSGGPPGSGGNTIDTRMFRMIDAGSENPTIKQKTIDIFKKVVDAAYSTGLVKQYGKSQSYGATGFPNVYGHDELAKVVGTTKMFGHSNGSVLPLAGSPLNNGHLTHIHISIVDEQYAKYTGMNGITASSPSSGDCSPPCVQPSTFTTTTDGKSAYSNNKLNDTLNSTNLNPFESIDVNAAYGTKPTSFTAIQADPKYVAFLKEIADTRGYEQYKDAGGKNSEMEAALAAMVSASGGKLVVSNTYRSYQEQVGTYFASGGVISPISKYWSPNLTASELAIVKAAYLARGTVSAPPGYSQHSTGLAVDFSPVSNSYEETAGYTWLKANGTTYGFEESYPKGTNKGAGFEPWHWQFVGNDKYKLSTPLSSFQIGGNTSSTVPCVTTTSNLGENSKLASENPPANLIITDETGKIIKQLNGGQAVTGASIFKVIIASVALKNNIDLNKQLILSQDIWLPDEKTYSKNQSVTISILLKDMLNRSNNTAANALMKEIGGMGAIGGQKPTGFSEKAKASGYNSVTFDRWFTASENIPGMVASGKRKASVEDTNKAFIDIFKNNGGGYDIAKDALQTNPHKFQDAQNIEAFKHGNTSSILGVSSKLNIGGKIYYTTMIYNIKTDKLLQGNPVYTFVPSNPITKFINEIKNELK